MGKKKKKRLEPHKQHKLPKQHKQHKPHKQHKTLVKQKQQKIYKDLGEVLRQHRSLVTVVLLVLALGAGLWAGFQYVVSEYTVTRIYVDGNLHYTDEEIMDIVMEGRFGNNSLYLSLKYKDKSISGIPFIEKMDVSIMEKDTIRINVYEKAIAGYVEYMGHYLYFDKDGIVVEASAEAAAGVLEVAGMEFDHAVMHEKLPAKDESIFTRTLSISQLMQKYGIAADKVYFEENGEIMLYFGKIKVALGDDYHIDEKVMELQNILPKLEGLSGTLRMENFDDFSNETIFESEM